jgi:uncharacterized protein with GYD domain
VREFYIVITEKSFWGLTVFFVVLAKLKGKMSPAFMEATEKALKSPPPGLKIHNVFWTLGQYDFIIIYEAPNEKAAIKMGTEWAEFCDTQTLVAVPNEEAKKMLLK